MALAVGAVLEPVAALAHPAPRARPVAREVVERPAALGVVAELQPLPGSLELGLEDDPEELGAELADRLRGGEVEGEPALAVAVELDPPGPGQLGEAVGGTLVEVACLLYTSPSPRDS